jgi:replicative DNA helicase
VNEDREKPNNIEAEQAVLGAILVNNAAYTAVSGVLSAAHFYEPLHRKVYEVVGEFISKGKSATPITIKTFLPAGEKVGQLTVAQYVGRLASEAVTVIIAIDYARAIVDLAMRRELIVIGQDMVEVAYDAPVDMPPRQIAYDAEAKMEASLANVRDEGGDESVDRTVTQIMEAFSAQLKKPSIPLPLIQLRDILGGEMEIGSLVGMLSASGEGKTSLAVQVVDYAASLGHPVEVLSFDQSADQIINQIVSQRTGIENTRIRNRTMMEREIERYLDCLSEVRKLPIKIRKCNASFDTAGHLVDYVKRSLGPMCRKTDKPGLVVLDHSRKVKPNDPKAHEGRIAADMNGIFKEAASSMGLVWFNLMQRSGSGVKRKNPRPIDSDIFGGEMGREDYDAVFYLYRGWKYWQSQLATADDAKDEERINARFQREKWEADQAELGVLKWRYGDPNRRFRVRFEAEYTRYTSMRPEPVAELFGNVA